MCAALTNEGKLLVGSEAEEEEEAAQIKRVKRMMGLRGEDVREFEADLRELERAGLVWEVESDVLRVHHEGAPEIKYRMEEMYAVMVSRLITTAFPGFDMKEEPGAESRRTVVISTPVMYSLDRMASLQKVIGGVAPIPPPKGCRPLNPPPGL